MHDREIEVDVLRDLPGFGLHRVVPVNYPSVGGRGTPVADGFDVASLAQGKTTTLREEDLKAVQYGKHRK